ncbi:3D (Asp-Asp-Asp) domain-containing protein [Oikeobacillus pervagus]|uniref:3D (Asp-Asp-Asp) domain-containing protein n=1 Tax=Oikeobacillus pervagus TaxID=1325931 RepID=A0AAJ1SZF7_9BACI|nr:3D domain-containing protein [Oikeobacillus pervagus]MDQ0214106.1 3D (Asp-Asp-Asp) domain-containing protein [Oikeobacillus pervagus]
MKKWITMFFATILVLSTLTFGASFTSAASQTYTVKRGDTLYKISRNYKTTVDQLKKWNNLKSNLIKVGEQLIVSETNTPNTAATPVVNNTNPSKKVITVKSTAYTANCKGCTGITATGFNLKKNPKAKVIAVDPKVIPLGTKVHVEGYGEAIAADKGGSIKGNKIDVYVQTKQEARNWGVRTVKVTILK